MTDCCILLEEAEESRSIWSWRIAAVALYACEEEIIIREKFMRILRLGDMLTLRQFLLARDRLRCEATVPWMSFERAVLPLILQTEDLSFTQKAHPDESSEKRGY